MTRLAVHALQPQIDAGSLEDGRLRSALETLAERAVADAPRADQRLMVYPGHLGIVVALAVAPPLARRAQTLAGALAAATAARPWTAVRAMFEHAVVDPRRTALAALAPPARAWMHTVFAGVARRHRSHVVAGSCPRTLSPGRIVNSATVYGPDGRIASVADQVNLLPGLDDAGGLALARGDAGPLRAAPLDFGGLVTLVGYDGHEQPLSRAERFAPVGQRSAAAGARPHFVAHPTAWPELAAARLRDDWAQAVSGLLAPGGVAVRACLVGTLVERIFAGSSVIVRKREHLVETVAEASSNKCDQVLTATLAPEP